MSRFQQWAQAGGPVYVTPQPTYQAPLYQAPPPPVLHQVPPPPGIVTLPQYGYGQRPLVMADPIPPTCALVRADATTGDLWAQRMAQLPDLAKQAGIDFSGGVDACRDFVTIPEGVALEKWTPSARYYNGKTDSTARGQIGTALSRHGESVEAVRSSRSRSLGTGPVI